MIDVRPQLIVSTLICLICTGSLIAQTVGFDVDAVSRAAVQVKVDDGSGSGTLLIHNNEALIFTNRHVIEGYDEAVIAVLVDLNEPAVPLFKARLRGYSADYDFAVLSLESDLDGNAVDASQLRNGSLGFSIPELAIPSALDKDADVRRGSAVSILGYPGIGDDEMVYTTGIIASVQFSDYNGQRLPLWYRTTAEMSPGNSGGMALNSRGEFIGIPTSVRTEERTGGRLGTLLAVPFAMALLDEPDGLQSNWSQTNSIRATTLDYSMAPTFGSANLAGADLDRIHMTYLAAGGPVDTSYLGAGCIGFAAVQPDYRFTLAQAAANLSVMFVVDDNGGDTVLIVNTPDGQWHCNDDFDNNSRDPGLIFPNAGSGQYDVWVGSYYRDEMAVGTLMILDSDLPDSSGTLNTTVTGELDFSQTPHFGTVQLSAGFLPDPHAIQIMGGGSVSVQNSVNGDNCRGFASTAPDFRLQWSGNSSALHIHFTADTAGDDATLVINTAAGRWLCNDDANGSTLNPGITLDNPAEGTYDIWVGSYLEGNWVHGELRISEVR
jgi:S1-C subfamily serine protease